VTESPNPTFAPEHGPSGGFTEHLVRMAHGHATRMLRAAPPVARELGIDSALVTCDEGNFASRKVIERNGGVLEGRRGAVLRFRVPTRPATGGRVEGQEVSGGAV
jgi:hypothetical protein